MTIKVVPSTADVAMTVTAPLQHLCPFVDEVDHGTVTITWRVNGATFELHSMAEYLRGFKDCETSHEDITDRIRHDLSATPGVDLISVESSWETAGMTVRVVGGDSSSLHGESVQRETQPEGGASHA